MEKRGEVLYRQPAACPFRSPWRRSSGKSLSSSSGNWRPLPGRRKLLRVEQGAAMLVVLRTCGYLSFWGEVGQGRAGVKPQSLQVGISGELCLLGQGRGRGPWLGVLLESEADQ